jgi:hypothetical protein
MEERKRYAVLLQLVNYCVVSLLCIPRYCFASSSNSVFGASCHIRIRWHRLTSVRIVFNKCFLHLKLMSPPWYWCIWSCLVSINFVQINVNVSLHYILIRKATTRRIKITSHHKTYISFANIWYDIMCVLCTSMCIMWHALSMILYFLTCMSGGWRDCKSSYKFKLLPRIVFIR